MNFTDRLDTILFEGIKKTWEERGGFWNWIWKFPVEKRVEIIKAMGRKHGWSFMRINTLREKARGKHKPKWMVKCPECEGAGVTYDVDARPSECETCLGKKRVLAPGEEAPKKRKKIKKPEIQWKIPEQPRTEEEEAEAKAEKEAALEAEYEGYFSQE